MSIFTYIDIVVDSMCKSESFFECKKSKTYSEKIHGKHSQKTKVKLNEFKKYITFQL